MRRCFGIICVLGTLTMSVGLCDEKPGVYERTQSFVFMEAHGVGLLMDIFVPTGAKNGHGIVDVVSGAWHSDQGKLRDHERAQFFDILCKHGYTVFAVRPGSITRFGALDMVAHVEQGIRWVKKNAAKYNIDATRLGLTGASAGGHLASLTGIINGCASTPENAAVAAVGIFFPPTDFTDYGGVRIDPREEGRLSELLRRLTSDGTTTPLSDDELRSRIERVSPALQANSSAPPFLLIHGGADVMVPIQQSRKLQSALQSEGVSAELIVKRGGGHPWPTIHEEVEVLACWFDRQLVTSAPKSVITIDGKFDDWKGWPSYTDPAGDTHDTDHETLNDQPLPIDHPDVDLLEYKVTHDNENLYFYLRSRGKIANTQKASEGKRAGRYYIVVTIDVDDNDETGYWIHEGGYYPSTRGYDVNAEVEFYDGEFNTACYLNHGATNAAELRQAFLDQSSGKWTEGNDGPYPAGFLNILPGTYKNYTQWVPHADGTLTFVKDKGPIVLGIASAAVSEDGHHIETKFPLSGFLKRADGKPVIALGQKIDISFSLEASGELAPGGEWASDTGEPVNGYILTPRK